MLFALPNENTTTPKFENARDDPKTTRKLLNEVINKRKMMIDANDAVNNS